MRGFLDELKWRGLVHQCTDEAGLARWLASADPAGGVGADPPRAYVGFDPTADSLTIGNLVPIMLLVHFQRHGGTPCVVMGGGTGLIGDPSGKQSERPLLSEEAVRANVRAQQRIFERLLDFSPDRPNRARLLNNIEWLAPLRFLDVLRDLGKHISVNEMIRRESIRERLHGRSHGISYTEFSYMVLQAYDFLHLYATENVRLQMGGSDQWGNIVAGVDLVRRYVQGSVRLPTSDHASTRARTPPPEPAHDEVFGLTAPLVTTAQGGKFGKTEGGAVWLSAERTRPYAFYQFWRNADDRDVIPWLKMFTLLPRDRIESLAAAHAADPETSEAQQVLAYEVTALVHGRAAADLAQRAAEALFSGQIADLPEATLEEIFAAAPSSEHDRALLAGEGVLLLDVLAHTTLARSRREARQLLHEGSVSVNGHRAAFDRRLTAADLLHGRLIALRRGKKTWHLTRWR